FADAEIERIQKRREFIARGQEGVELYLTQLIDCFAVPDRRGIKRLEGNFFSIRIQKNPNSVLITDFDAIPLAFKQVCVTLPAYAWEALLQCAGAEERTSVEGKVNKLELRPDKKAIGAELRRGACIPGADLKFGDWRLVIS